MYVYVYMHITCLLWGYILQCSAQINSSENMEIPIAVAEVVSQASSAASYSACSSHSTFVDSSRVLEERIILVTKEMKEKERLIILLIEEKDKLKAQYKPFLRKDVFEE